MPNNEHRDPRKTLPPNRATPTRVLVIIAIVVIALPFFLMVGMATIAALIGMAGRPLSAGEMALAIVVLVALVAAGAALVRAGMRA